MANRWTKFFWSDYAKDEGLQCCSLAAQGLWFRMLAIMADAEPIGHLVIGEVKFPVAQLAARACVTVEEVQKLIDELEFWRVFSRVRGGRMHGVIFCRRMVRENDLYLKRRDAGATGGRRSADGRKQSGSNPEANGKQNGSKTEANGKFPDAERLAETNGLDGGSESLLKQTPKQNVVQPEARIQKQAKQAAREAPEIFPDGGGQNFSGQENSRTWHAGKFPDHAVDAETGREIILGWEISTCAEMALAAAEIIPGNSRDGWMQVAEWLQADLEPDDFCAVIRKRRERLGETTVRSLRYFDQAVREHCRPSGGAEKYRKFKAGKTG